MFLDLQKLNFTKTLKRDTEDEAENTANLKITSENEFHADNHFRCQKI